MCTHVQFCRRVRKIAKSDYYFFMPVYLSVRLSVRMKQLGSLRTDSHEN